MATENGRHYSLRSRSIPLKSGNEIKKIRDDQISQRRQSCKPRPTVRRTPLPGPSARDPVVEIVWFRKMTGFARRAMNFYNKECIKEGKPIYKMLKLVKYRCVGLSMGILVHLNFEAQLDKNPESQVELFFGDLYWPYKYNNKQGPITVRQSCSLGPKGSESGVTGSDVCIHCNTVILHPRDGNFVGRDAFRSR